jgi:hypothetical protein|tara:strand:+ start:439 stop:591 length:153 start_codon:yes stop_codon:yes gene_type:complete
VAEELVDIQYHHPTQETVEVPVEALADLQLLFAHLHQQLPLLREQLTQLQ